MISILTGDVINSKDVNPKKWMPSLKAILSSYAVENVGWEIYRGDSFQIEIPVRKALSAAIKIKASIKKHANLDVRIAIGIGKKTYKANKITEANGSAFIYSGACFESLKKRTLAIKSSNADFDYTMNTIISMALLTMNNWTENSALLIKSIFDNPALNQKELAAFLHKSQSTISEGFKRSGYEEISNMLDFYQYKVKNTKW